MCSGMQRTGRHGTLVTEAGVGLAEPTLDLHGMTAIAPFAPTTTTPPSGKGLAALNLIPELFFGLIRCGSPAAENQIQSSVPPGRSFQTVFYFSRRAFPRHAGHKLQPRRMPAAA